MKKITAIIAVIISMLLILLLASGCKQNIAERIAEEAIEKAIEQDSGENVEIDLDEGEITIESDEGEVNISSDEESVEISSDEGEVNIGTGTELPEGFPGIVPVYPDMEINASWKATEEDKNSFSISGVTEDSVEDVIAWYKDNLGGWNIEGEYTMSADEGTTSTLNVSGDGYTLDVMVVDSEDDQTAIFMSVLEE